MRSCLLILSAIFVGICPAIATADPRPECTPQSASELPPDSPSVSPTFEDLKAKYEKSYQSGRRLRHRAYWDKGQNAYVVETGIQQLTRVPTEFLRNLTRHIEIATERGYADFVFYSDMGHGHFLESATQVSSDAGEMLASNKLKILYHSAELLTLRSGKWFDGPLPTDPHLGWRYFSRNFVADNVTGENLAVLFQRPPGYNTVRSLEGYAERGTFMISASKDGCFPFQQNGRTLYFDFAILR